jgi:hypothetical protein
MSASRTLAAICVVSLVAAMTGRGAQKSPGKPSGDSSSDVLPLPAVEKTLPSGLKVIVVPTGFPNIVSLQIPVQAGSRNEVEPGKSGFAHFFEHMMFRGTKAYPSDRYNQVVTQAGARQNAFTSDDFTNYHTTFAKEDLETILAIEADRFKSSTTRRKDSRPKRARFWASTTRTAQTRPLVKIEEVQHDKAFTTHTYKHHDDGLPLAPVIPGRRSEKQSLEVGLPRPRTDDLAHVDGVVPPIHSIGDAGFDPGRQVGQERGAGRRAGLVRHVVKLSALDVLRWPEELLRDVPLIVGQEVDGERAARLDCPVREAVTLDADHHERRVKRALRQPGERRSGRLAAADRGHDEHPVGNPAQDLPFRVFVHRFVSFRP